MVMSLSEVKRFWERQSCGEVYAQGNTETERLKAHSEIRFILEPYIFDFARFNEGQNNDVLEIGVGMGADHERWAQSNPKSLSGVDLTERAIQFTRERQVNSMLTVASAEELPYQDNSFDLVYSWGVLHHTSNTQHAINEVYRVLRPGRIARIMIYNRRSITTFLLWLKYGLRERLSLRETLAKYLESPGTQGFTASEAEVLFRQFSHVNVRTLAGTSDLLLGNAGQRHQGILLSVMRRIWPRWFIKRYLNRYGLVMLIEAFK